jgi:hypothetical protein
MVEDPIEESTDKDDTKDDRMSTSSRDEAVCTREPQTCHSGNDREASEDPHMCTIYQKTAFRRNSRRPYKREPG